MTIVNNLIIFLSSKKMFVSLSKVFLAYVGLGAIVLKTNLVNWGEYGLIGLVIGAVFYFLFKPMMKMMIDDKKSDNEIKAKLAENIQGLSLVLSEHIIKSNTQSESLKDMMKQRDEKLQMINSELKEINQGIKGLNSKIDTR